MAISIVDNIVRITVSASGPSGLSAYQVAVANGFAGSETEWLESLKGISGSANITLYPTTAPSDIGGYYKLVSDITDSDYDDPSVDVSTGAITGADQLISSLATTPGLLIGNPGVFNITIVGNIKRVSGTGTASFHFHAYHRDQAGVETSLGISSDTIAVTSTTYTEYNASLMINDGSFLETDRLVFKFYGTRIAGGSNPTYNFEFGGETPVRALVPVPTYVIPHDNLAGISLAGSGVSKGHIDNQAQNIAGVKTFTDGAKAAAGTDYTTARFRNITLSTSDPSGGNNGDIWIKYTA